MKAIELLGNVHGYEISIENKDIFCYLKDDFTYSTIYDGLIVNLDIMRQD